MKRTLSIIAALTACVLMAAQAQTLSSDEVMARSVLTQYFDALSQGDTATVRSLLGGDLLDKRARLLDNPSYSEFLITHYQDAKFEITGSSVRGPDTVIVNAVIAAPGEQDVAREYVLVKEMRAGMTAPQFFIEDERLPSQ